MSSSPSLRRVVTGYLSLRDPYNLTVDALIGLVASYLLGWAVDWFSFQEHMPAAGATVTPAAWRMAGTVVGTVAGVLYFAAIGVFLVGIARIIAARDSQPGSDQ